MQERAISRHYIAITHGMLSESRSINAPIARHPTTRTKMAVVTSGKHAVTHISPVDVTQTHSLLSVELDTGRTHQIRVHLNHIGYPIVGDAIYGKKKDASFTRQALHAYALQLPHPTSKEIIETQAAIPCDMLSLIDALGLTYEELYRS